MRQRLPNRRACATLDMTWGSKRWMCTVGFYNDGRPGELFVSGSKVGSEVDALVDDACVVVSLLLQSGYPVADLRHHLGRESTDPAEPVTASVIGAALRLLEQEAGV